MGMDSGKVPSVSGCGKNKKSKKQRLNTTLQMYQQQESFNLMLQNNSLLNLLIKKTEK